MPLPAGFIQFGPRIIRLVDVSAVEAFKRGTAEFVVRVYLASGASFDLSFKGTGNGPVVDEADRDAIVAALEAGL